ncbi:MAG: sterol desaturase family protein, partial [Bdellovibrionales bacterium]|nr:sterol desaturase family protein [Bdellovibrionales bacterium]
KPLSLVFAMTFFEKLYAPFFIFFESDKRLFWLYLLSSLVIGLVALYLREKSWKKSFQKFFNKKFLFHSSHRLDLSLFIFNIFLKMGVFALVTFTAASVSLKINQWLNDFFPSYQPLAMGYQQVLFAYTLTSFIILDFSRFFQHYIFHKVPFLWEFHKVHHTARVLSPLTLFRTHPLESLVASFRRILVLGFLAGLFTFLTRSMIGVYAILGVNAFDFLFNLAGSNLRHSHIWLSFGPFNYLFISPAQHQIHHSRDQKYYDTNLGIVFSVWDQIFGTFYHPKKKEFISFGVRGEEHANLKDALVKPFRSWFT